MQHHIIVSFGKDAEYEYRLSAPGAAEEARQWFDREFVKLECDVATPTGKILAVDRILSVAKYAGNDRFRTDRPRAVQVFRACDAKRTLHRRAEKHHVLITLL